MSSINSQARRYDMPRARPAWEIEPDFSIASRSRIFPARARGSVRNRPAASAGSGPASCRAAYHRGRMRRSGRQVKRYLLGSRRRASTSVFPFQERQLANRGERREEAGEARGAQWTIGRAACRHTRLMTATASWLTQSTGNSDTSARPMRPGSSARCARGRRHGAETAARCARPAPELGDLVRRARRYRGSSCRRDRSPRRPRPGEPTRRSALRAKRPRCAAHRALRAASTASAACARPTSRRGVLDPRAALGLCARRRPAARSSRAAPRCACARRGRGEGIARRRRERLLEPADGRVAGDEAVAKLPLLALDLVGSAAFASSSWRSRRIGPVGRPDEVREHVHVAERVPHHLVGRERVRQQRPIGAGMSLPAMASSHSAHSAGASVALAKRLSAPDGGGPAPSAAAWRLPAAAPREARPACAGHGRRRSRRPRPRAGPAAGATLPPTGKCR